MATLPKDAIIPDNAPKTLLLEKHIKFLANYGKDKDEYHYVMSGFLRMSGVYWAVTALDMMHSLHLVPRDEIILSVKSCQAPSGGFRPAEGHDPHLLYTLSAVQILCILDAIDTIDVNKTVDFVAGLQQDDGSFFGDQWGEVDTRFSFCAVACLSLLKRLDAIDVEKATEYILSCMNFDGGFGARPGAESHSGLIYCCIGFLSIIGRLDAVKADTLGWWLCERQLASGGLNGRPEKLPDVCYSWWVLSSLSVLGRLHWIDKDSLCRFILATQDEDSGGFSDRPGHESDPFHTVFGLAGLSLMGEDRLRPVNPTYCMPQHVIDRLGLEPQKLVVGE